MNVQREQPTGFSLRNYLWNVMCSFKNTFQKEGKPNQIIRTIKFTPTSLFNNYNITNTELPALFLDLYQAKLIPVQDEFKHDQQPFMNTDTLPIYIFMKAIITTDNIELNPHLHVRQLAFWVAGHVTSAGRFGSRVGLSQVTHIHECTELQRNDNRLLQWEVRWQHLITIEKPQLKAFFELTENLEKLGQKDIRRILISELPENSRERIDDKDYFLLYQRDEDEGEK